MNAGQFFISKRDEYLDRIERAERHLARMKNKQGAGAEATRTMIAAYRDILAVVDRYGKKYERGVTPPADDFEDAKLAYGDAAE